MTLTAGARKAALTVHVVTSVGWLGAALTYAAVIAAAIESNDARAVRAACSAIQPITWYALIPLALASLLSGVVQSLGTPWGLFRHYWVIYKLALTLAATGILLGNTRAVSELAARAVDTGAVEMSALTSQLVHSAGGTLVLFLATVLGVFKPRGLTRYGWRLQREQSP